MKKSTHSSGTRINARNLPGLPLMLMGDGGNSSTDLQKIAWKSRVADFTMPSGAVCSCGSASSLPEKPATS